ncbi:MAG: hypothetical protein HFF36_05545 [Coprobacillus sp.]|nr:hypothetical protein [Coprobacillus sp.]
MFINLYLFIIIILSSCYLLYKNDLLNFQDKKTILVSIFYVIISSILCCNEAVIHLNYFIKQGILFGILVIAMLLMSNQKIQAVYYSLIIFIIALSFDWLNLYLKVWYFHFNDLTIIGYLLMIVIVFILNKYQFIQYNKLSLIYNMICIVGWLFVSYSFLVIESKNPIYIIFSFLIGWSFINKMISIYNNKKINIREYQ